MNTTTQPTNKYKNSPLGIIPKEWEVNQLKNITLIKGDYGINAAAVEYRADLPTYIRITDIDDDGCFSTNKKMSVDDVNSDNFYLGKNDLVFVRTGATVGKSYLYNENDGKLVFAGFLIRFKIDTSKIDDYFLWSFTKSKPYWDWVKTVSMRSGQPGINSTEYSLLHIPIPPLPEQKAIADCLFTWDKAIEKHAALITQKELSKKALMQQLLSGKKRLKGFSEEWKEVRLGDIFALSSGDTKPFLVEKNKSKSFLYPVYGGNSIMAYSQEYNYDGKTILIGRVGEYCGITSCINGKFWITDNALFISKFLIPFSLDFLLYKLIYEDLSKLRNKGGQPLVSQKPIYAKKINLPPIEEQTAIANVLQCADTEIKLLKNKLIQLKEQKKGLMQVLLTGKKRLRW